MGSLRIDPDYVADGCNVRGDLPMTFAFGRMAVIDDTTGAVEKECPGVYGVEIANAKGTRAMRCYMDLAALQEAAVSMLSFCRDEEVGRLLGTEEDGSSSGQEASEDPRPQPGSRGAYLISETMNEMASRMWDAYTDPESNGIDQDDASQLALQVSAAYREERQEASEDPRPQPEAEEPKPVPHTYDPHDPDICLGCEVEREVGEKRGLPRIPGAHEHRAAAQYLAEIAGPRYIAHFHASKQVGPDEYETVRYEEWDCTQFVLKWAKVSEVSVDAALELLATDTGQRTMQQDPAVPDWARNWQGPFTITVRRKDG